MPLPQYGRSNISFLYCLGGRAKPQHRYTLAGTFSNLIYRHKYERNFRIRTAARIISPVKCEQCSCARSQCCCQTNGSRQWECYRLISRDVRLKTVDVLLLTSIILLEFLRVYVPHRAFVSTWSTLVVLFCFCIVLVSFYGHFSFIQALDNR